MLKTETTERRILKYIMCMNKDDTTETHDVGCALHTNNFKKRNKEKKGELDTIKDEGTILLTQGKMAEF